jgi:prevent-host-death family protein
MVMVMHTWQLQEAKSRFSEVVDLTLKEGPQLVTRRGEEAVVILAADDYRRLTGQTPRLMDCLLNAPRGEPLVLERSREAIRDVAL